MIAFEIFINRKRICAAGIGEEGVLSTIISWAGSARRRRQRRSRPERADLHIGGLANDQHSDWIDGFQMLKVGDTVRVRVIETIEPDPPIRSRSSYRIGRECGFCYAEPIDGTQLIMGPIVPICAECIYACQQYLES
jgi:hypothetical protein